MTSFKLSALALLISSTALLAGPVEDMVQQLRDQGYTEIEIDSANGITEIEAENETEERTIRIDEATGAVLSDTVEAEETDTDDADDND